MGYQLMCPWMFTGLEYAQKVFFDKPYITENFSHMNGFDLIGSYFRRGQLRKLIDASLEMILKDQARLEKIHEETYLFNKEYFDYADSLRKIDLKSASGAQLADYVLKLTDLQEKAHAHAVITTWFVDSDGQDLSTMLIDLTEKHIKKSKSLMKTSEAFSLLTTPTKVSLLNQEEMESLEVLIQIVADASTKRVISGLSSYDVMPKGLNVKIENTIVEHVRKWKWTPFGYQGPAYSLADYLNTWQEQIRQRIDPVRVLAEKKGWFTATAEKKAKLKKELKISETDSRIFDIGADIVFLKGYRKDCSFHGYFVYDLFLSEAARRFFLSKNQLQVMNYVDLAEMMKTGKEADVAVLNQRVKGSAILLYDKGMQSILSGADALEYLKREDKLIEKEVVDTTATEMKGVCACHGSATGIIKIVNVPEEMGKMNQGDIMISHTTFPSLVPAMKKAAAIVTEDGGVTCHAAIVSRELGTPCVTGIKGLTKILKDGDRVKVDADKGIVTVIERAK